MQGLGISAFIDFHSFFKDSVGFCTIFKGFPGFCLILQDVHGFPRILRNRLVETTRSKWISIDFPYHSHGFSMILLDFVRFSWIFKDSSGFCKI